MLSHVDAIVKLNAPTSLKELRKVLGGAGYYRKFVPRYADIIEPLNALLRSDTSFYWSKECQLAFEKLKQELVSANVLAHFDPSLDTIVTTDASAVAIGAVLSQVQADGTERPVAFASRTLSQTERNYAVSEREALACIWSCERWHWYLYGRHFTLRTDHSALTTLLAGGSKGHRPMRLLRWADRLNEYRFNIQYKPGVENVVADLLSRSTTASDSTTQQNAISTDDMSLYIRTIFGGSTFETLSLSEVAESTAEDKVLSQVMKRCNTGWLKADTIDPVLSSFYKLAEEFSVEEGVLFRGERAVIPTSLRSQVLQLAHEGHPGIVKMRQRLRDCVWWPGMSVDVDGQVKHCEACLLSGKSARPVVAPLQHLQFPPKPWHTIAIDIKGELHGEASSWRYLIVVYDLHSKWPEVRAVNTVTSSVVIAFLKDLFSRWGLPTRIISDNGKQFVSREIEAFLSSLSIAHSRTALYHPQSNGAVERFNRYLTDQLRIARIEGRTVEEALFTALSAYRSTRHSTTQRSPAELMCGRNFIMPLDRLKKLPTPRKVEFDNKLERNVRSTNRRNERNYDKRKHVSTPIFEHGQSVYVRDNVRNNKYEPLWSVPRKIQEKINDTTMRLDNGTVRNTKDLVPAISKPEAVGESSTIAGTQAASVPVAEPEAVTESPVIGDTQAASVSVANSPVVISSTSETSPQPIRKSDRIRRRPARFGDYNFDYNDYH